MEKQLEDYRTHLVTAEQKMQEEYDKTIISLSGASLGISFAFIKDIIGTNAIVYKGILLYSWICWGISVALVLISYFLSHLALRKAIDQFDEAVRTSQTDAIYKQRAGGYFSLITAILNASGGILFFVGLILIAIFIWHNFGG